MNRHDPELIKVITDFLEQGFADSIAAMFRKDPSLYSVIGELLRDERFAVRMGTAVLFEELVETRPEEVRQAIPHLKPLLADDIPWVRGEAAHILGIIGTSQALSLLEPMLSDPDHQVREIAADFLNQ